MNTLNNKPAQKLAAQKMMNEYKEKINYLQTFLATLSDTDTSDSDSETDDDSDDEDSDSDSDSDHETDDDSDTDDDELPVEQPVEHIMHTLGFQPDEYPDYDDDLSLAPSENDEYDYDSDDNY
jgi:hypothetical protein